MFHLVGGKGAKMDNKNEIVQAIKSLLVLSIVFFGAFAVLFFISTPVYMWIAIFFIMLVGIILATVFLHEEPLVFFDDFGEWKRARVSSSFMLMAVISFVAIIVSLIKK